MQTVQHHIAVDTVLACHVGVICTPKSNLNTPYNFYHTRKNTLQCVYLSHVSHTARGLTIEVIIKRQILTSIVDPRTEKKVK